MHNARKDLYSTRGSLVCKCGSQDLHTEVCFDGLTDHQYCLEICCHSCGLVTYIARLNTDSSNTIVVKSEPNSIEKLLK